MEQNLPFDIDPLLIFGKVVECRSLSRAAALLGMPKSTVSRRIARLEADLGIRLLRRNTHQISVTDLGERIYTHVEKILAEANDIRALVEGSKQEPQGKLRAAIPVFVGIDYASKVGTLFLQRYPRSQLEIRLVDDTVHPIRDGFDVVFGTGPLQDSTLIAKKVFTLECVLCASADFLARLPAPLTTPAQLNDTAYIDSDFFGSRRKLTLVNGKRRVELAPAARARANSFQIARQYISQGLGAGVIPTLMIRPEDRHSGAVLPILPEWSPEAIDVYMIYPFQLSFSTLIGAFHEVALEIIRQNTEALAGLHATATG